MIARWFRNFFRRIGLWFSPPFKTKVVEEALPTPLAKRTLYVVQEDGFVEQAAMLCPDGCGKVLHMNLIPDERTPPVRAAGPAALL